MKKLDRSLVVFLNKYNSAAVFVDPVFFCNILVFFCMYGFFSTRARLRIENYGS